MVCKVCKRELTSPVCSFCGEDNSDYIDTQEKDDATSPDTNASFDRDKMYDDDVKIKKYKVDYKKLAALVGVLILIVAAIIIVVSWLTPNKDEKADKSNALFSSQMLLVCQNGEWGYIASTDTESFAIEPQFRIASGFMGDVAFVYISDKYAIINKTGDLLTVPKFDSFANMSANGYIAVMENGKWGYVNNDAEYVINPKFSSASKFYSGVSAVSVNGAYGYIGEDGEYTVAPQYDMALDFSEDDELAAIKTDGTWGYINKDGTIVIEPRFEEALTFENGRAIVKLHNAYGLIDTDGKFIIEPVFDEPFSFEKDGSATIKIGSRYGYIDREGEFLIVPRFCDMGSFGDANLTYAQRSDGKYGFVDKSGSFVIEPQFEDALAFSQGLAPVKLDGLWGYVDEKGDFAIDPRFSYATSFYADGYAVAEDALGKTVVINATGNNVLNSEMNLSDVMAK